jgi:hypothetical protein
MQKGVLENPFDFFKIKNSRIFMNILTKIFFTIAIMFTLNSAYAGNCDHSWQTASDGSSCGDRSADSRPGGR